MSYLDQLSFAMPFQSTHSFKAHIVLDLQTNHLLYVELKHIGQFWCSMIHCQLHNDNGTSGVTHCPIQIHCKSVPKTAKNSNFFLTMPS